MKTMKRNPQDQDLKDWYQVEKGRKGFVETDC